MPAFTREERYFRQLMEADAVLRPALIRHWSRRDRVLGERLALMLGEFLRADAEEDVPESPGDQIAV